MPYRTPLLVNEEVYHVFNRSVGDERIFVQERNLNRALGVIDFYRFSQRIKYSKFKTLSPKLQEDYLRTTINQRSLVEIFAFSLMPNHYHFLLRQLQDNGILKFISNFQNSFAKYFNLKSDRQGTLFQNAFKGVRVETDEQLTHISRYIHLNPVTAFLIEFGQLFSYPWNSFSWYMNEELNRFLDASFILKMFPSKEGYKQFVADQVDYQRKLGLIKGLILE